MSVINAIYKKFNSLYEVQHAFPDDKSCIKFLEDVLWEGVPVSPFDINSKVYQCKKNRYRCKNTKKYFTVTTDTLFQGTKIPLPIWFQVIFRMQSDKRGIAATTVARDYGITRMSAWKMLQKIRKALAFENFQTLEGTVEVDEYYEGGSFKNMHYDKKLEAKKKLNQNKKLMQGFVERGGNAVIRVISDITDGTLIAGVLRHVKRSSTLYSDDNQSYQKLPPFYNQGVVVHSKGNYVNKNNKDIFTNTVESLWAVFERTKKTYIHVSLKYLQNYANEAVFRYNTRKMEAGEACIHFLLNIKNTKITWKELSFG